MIAEENLLNDDQPNISVTNTNVVLLIGKLMKQTVPNFKTYIASDFYKKRKLNEDEFTQIYIEQAQILIRNIDYPFNISGQYRDITNLSKGFSDFYFYPNEESISTVSLFSVESKRLPAPEKSREKEYVIGVTNNGGIERYKTEKHGKGMKESGLLGFVEKEDFTHWTAMINNWINDLARTNKSWSIVEVLTETESNNEFCVLRSIAHRENDEVKLSHLWIMVN